MSWEEIGIQNPGIEWREVYQDWRINRLGELYELTANELEDYRGDIDDMKELGFYVTKLSDFEDWIDYIDTILEEASKDINFRSGLINARIELYKFKKYFDVFTIEIEWLGD